MDYIPPNSTYPDTIAMVFDETNMKLTCVYNDHSLYIWDVNDINRVIKFKKKIRHFFIAYLIKCLLIRLESQIRFYFIRRVFGV